MPAKKTARIALRVSEDLKARIEAEADLRGQKLTTFVERALESALAGGLPETERMPPVARPAPASTRAARIGKGDFKPRPKGGKK